MGRYDRRQILQKTNTTEDEKTRRRDGGLRHYNTVPIRFGGGLERCDGGRVLYLLRYAESSRYQAAKARSWNTLLKGIQSPNDLGSVKVAAASEAEIPFARAERAAASTSSSIET